MLPVVRGVLFLQSLGLAHRDLSLENVLLRRAVYKVADFGAAVSAGEARRDRVDKRQYMAPEVAACGTDDAYDPVPADGWSLGVMLFMLIAGSPLVAVALPGDAGLNAFSGHRVGAILAAWGVQSVAAETVALLVAPQAPSRP